MIRQLVAHFHPYATNRNLIISEYEQRLRYQQKTSATFTDILSTWHERLTLSAVCLYVRHVQPPPYACILVSTLTRDASVSTYQMTLELVTTSVSVGNDISNLTCRQHTFIMQ